MFLKQHLTLAVIAVLAVNPSGTVAGGGPPEATARPAAARMGSLAVESEPAGADVYVDGRMTGQTPLKLASLAAGDHRVRLVKGGYLENARVVSVGAALSTVRVRLTRDAGSRPELAAQFGGGESGGGPSRLPLYLALAGGGAVGAYLLSKKDSSSSSVNQAPTVGSFTASPATAIVATTTTFAVVNATDADGDPLTFSWDFGDGTPAGTGATTTHVYPAAATRTVTVTVSDGKTTAAATGSLVVKSLSGTWTGTLNCCGGPLNTTVAVTQANTTLTGSYTDQIPSDASTLTSGSVNVTTRQVTLNFVLNAGGGSWSFVGTLNAAATTLTGVTSNAAGGSPPDGSTWTMSRP